MLPKIEQVLKLASLDVIKSADEMQTEREGQTVTCMDGQDGQIFIAATREENENSKAEKSTIPAKTNLSKWKWNGIARNQRRRRRRRRRLNSDSMESDEERCSHVTHVK